MEHRAREKVPVVGALARVLMMQEMALIVAHVELSRRKLECGRVKDYLDSTADMIEAVT